MGFGSSPRLVRAGLIGGLATASGVALTATSGWLIVQASTMPPILTLLVAIVAVRTFGIARPLLRYAERLASHEAALTALAQRRVETYAALVPLTPARLGAHAKADVLTGAVRDLDDEVDAQVRVVVPIFAAVTAALIAVVATTVLLPVAGLIVAAVVAAMAASAVMIYHRERPVQSGGLAARAAASRTATIVTSNATALQAISGEQRAQEWLVSAHAQVRRAAARQGLLRGLGLLWQQATVAVSTLAMAVAVAPQVGDRVSAPVAALLVLVPVALADASATLPDAIGAWARASAARDRLQSLLAQEPAVAGIPPIEVTPGEDEGTSPVAPTAFPPALAMRGVCARWQADRPALTRATLSIAPADQICIVGANGSGKSTLFAVLARHLDPTDGIYLVDDVDVTAQPVEQARALFAIVDDEPHVFASTLRENLRLAKPDSADSDLEQALHQAGLGGWFAGLSDGLDTMLGTGGRGISGGERARLAVARALLSGRPVLLLDEPVAHLDHATAVAVLDEVRRAAGGRTVVVISHRPDGVDGMSRVVDLADVTSTTSR